ncbi:MAG: 4'-phosphopantetheinyl transferase superfamily protein [Gammaproteobacteria bacterium]
MFPSLPDNEVHVWFCRPETIQDEKKISAYRSILSEQEIEQHHRFHFEKDKHNYLVSHALLRHALSKYADVKVSEWQFSSNAHGKPELIQGTGLPVINFNLTHTDGLCACVVTLNMACGIDAENIHRKNRLDAIAQRMFAEEELAMLRKNKNIQHQFYDLWTLREAYVKALGTGLAGSSKDFYFEVDAKNLSACINFRNGKQAESSHWQFKLFEPTQEHRLSIAFASSEPVSVQMTEFIP